jgi:hypothetical protein
VWSAVRRPLGRADELLYLAVCSICTALKKLLDSNVFIASQFVSALSELCTSNVKNMWLLVGKFATN